jgi:death-on-curing protein
VKEPIWIESADVLAVNDRLLALDGSDAVCDGLLLNSVLEAPPQHHAAAQDASIVDLAALYIAGMVRELPFTHGNAATGFVVGVLFLELNGYRFKAAEAEAAQAVLELASGTLERAGFAAFLRDHAKKVWPHY